MGILKTDHKSINLGSMNKYKKGKSTNYLIHLPPVIVITIFSVENQLKKTISTTNIFVVMVIGMGESFLLHCSTYTSIYISHAEVIAANLIVSN